MFKKEIFILINYKTRLSKIEGYITAIIDYNLIRTTRAKAIKLGIENLENKIKEITNDKFIITDIKIH